ncbi:protein kinase domain-containing protein, partial [Dactylosporangium fulvum]
MTRVLDGRYEVGPILGRGGMAEVRRGFDRRLERPVAIKVLHRAGLDDPAMLTRFDREARTVARLAHPNIVAVHDVGTDDGVPYLVMELVEGRSLAEALAGGPLAVREVARVGTQVCDALAAAHAAGVVHRDVKPANILLSATGHVKVCDFGIARLPGAAQVHLTASATALGTTAYMAPEQAASGQVDARADLYALGCVLFEMLTGRPPFTADTPVRVLWQHVHEQPAPVSALRPGVPPELDALVAALLAKR